MRLLRILCDMAAEPMLHQNYGNGGIRHLGAGFGLIPTALVEPERGASGELRRTSPLASID